MTEIAGIDRRELIAAGAVVAATGLLACVQGAAAQQSPAAAPTRPGRVTIERRGGVLLIGIDRPETQNTLDAPIIIGLGKALYQLDHDDGLRVGVLHGLGRDFCLGIDRPAFAAAQAAGILPPKDPDFINPTGLRPPARSKPLVVAVQGGTKYAGHELFLAGDIRVAANDTVFSQGEVARGLFPGGGATVRFTREAGWGNAMRYMLTGEEWGAEEARRLGLVQDITPAGQQLDRAVALAEKIAGAAPLGVVATLASAHQALATDETTALAAIPAAFGKILQSEDAKEFVRALQEGRKPLFRGI
jgi:enoyl-CoA hydratase